MQAFGFSREASFLTPPVVSAESHVKFLAIADLGQAEIDGSNEQSEMLPSLNTTQRMALETDYHQLLVHNGDIRCVPIHHSYSDGPRATACPAMLIM